MDSELHEKSFGLTPSPHLTFPFSLLRPPINDTWSDANDLGVCDLKDPVGDRPTCGAGRRTKDDCTKRIEEPIRGPKTKIVVHSP